MFNYVLKLRFLSYNLYTFKISRGIFAFFSVCVWVLSEGHILFYFPVHRRKTVYGNVKLWLFYREFFNLILFPKKNFFLFNFN